MALRRKIKKKVTSPQETKKQSVKKKTKKVKTKIVNSQKPKKPTIGKGKKVQPQELKLKKGIVENPKHLVPFDKGWKRMVVYRSVVSCPSQLCDIYYITPEGKKCRSSTNVIPELTPGLTLDNFSFSKKPLGVNNPDKEIVRKVMTFRKVSSHQNKHTPTKDLKKAKQAVNGASSSSKAKTIVRIQDKPNQRPTNNATIKAKSSKPVSKGVTTPKKHIKVTSRNGSSKSVTTPQKHIKVTSRNSGSKSLVANPVSNRAKPHPKKKSTSEGNACKPKLKAVSQSNISRKSWRSKKETKSKLNLIPKVILKDFRTYTNRTLKRKHSSEDDSYSDSDIEFVPVLATNNSELVRCQTTGSLRFLDGGDKAIDYACLGVDPNLFHCFHCGYSCGGKPLLRSHMFSHIREFERLTCDNCGYRATKHSDLLAHLHMDHKPFECYHCDFRTKKLEYLRRHIETHLGIRRFACPKCDYRSHNSYTMKMHVQGHSTKLRFKCKYCEYQTARSSNLRTHQLVHSGLKKYACDYCSYRSKWRRDLKHHVFTHIGFKPYVCSFCDYKCVSARGLKSHIRVHTGEKPFTCKYCDFASAHRSALRKHVAGHKGVFPFLCPYCSYKTQYQTNLKHHVMCHEDYKPHNCPHCDFRFISISELNNHMRRHTGEKPFSCNLCSFRCGAMPSLKKHLMDCDPARYRSLSKPKKNGVKRLHCVEEGSHRLAGIDLEGISLDDLSLGGSVSSLSSNEEIVNLTPQPVKVQKNARKDVNLTPHPVKVQKNARKDVNLTPHPVKVQKNARKDVNLTPHPVKVQKNARKDVNLTPHPVKVQKNTRKDVNLTPHPVKVQKNARKDVNLTPQPVKVQNNTRKEVKTCVSNSQSKRNACAYAFFDNDTFIGEYSV